MRFRLFSAVLLLVSAMSGVASARLDAPEVDPGSASSAVTLLVAGYLLLRGRARRKHV